MNRADALAVLAAANIPPKDAEAQLFVVEQALGKLGTSIEQHADLLRNTASLEVRVDYLSAVFGNYAVPAAHTLVNAIVHQDRPVPRSQLDERNAVVTHQLPVTARGALEDFDMRHLYERDAILAQWGLSSYHLTPVEYRAVTPVENSGERRGKEQP